MTEVFDKLSKLDTLGAFRDHSMEDRNEYYTQDICVPTQDDLAQNIARSQILERLIDHRKSWQVLELGCHDGFMTRRFINKDHVGKVLGIDMNQNAIDEANKIREEKYADKNLSYIQGDVFQFLRDNEEKFDVVVATEFIEHFHMPEIFDLLRLAYDTVEDGGILYMSTPHINGRYGKENPDKEHITLFDCALMESVIDDVLGVPSDVFSFGESVFAVVEK